MKKLVWIIIVVTALGLTIMLSVILSTKNLDAIAVLKLLYCIFSVIVTALCIFDVICVVVKNKKNRNLLYMLDSNITNKNLGFLPNVLFAMGFLILIFNKGILIMSSLLLMSLGLFILVRKKSYIGLLGDGVMFFGNIYHWSIIRKCFINTKENIICFELNKSGGNNLLVLNIKDNDFMGINQFLIDKQVNTSIE